MTLNGRREGTGRRLGDDSGTWAAPSLEGMRLPSDGIGLLMSASFASGVLVLLALLAICGKL